MYPTPLPPCKKLVVFCDILPIKKLIVYKNAYKKIEEKKDNFTNPKSN